MKERPILFSGAMVRAILSGQKTQTRRVVKHKWPHLWQEPWYATGNVLDDLPSQPGAFMEFRHRSYDAADYTGSGASTLVTCPYGQPGDRLWVQESWGYRGSRISTEWPGIQKVDIEYHADGQRSEYERPANDDSGIPKQRPCREDEDYIEDYYNGYLNRYWKQWRPSIHMPRWACRIVLEIVSVRVERLNDISEADAEAEGVNFMRSFQDFDETLTAKDCFEVLWESINGPESWQANPWVWVVEFKRVA